MSYNIALLDDHRVVLESFANLLATNDQFRVVGMASKEQELWWVLEQMPVDVVVTDLMMPGLQVSDLITAAKAKYPSLRVLVLSGTDDAAQIHKALRSGADGFVTKTADKAELFDAIRAVASGRRYIDSRVFDMSAESPAEPSPETLLSEREAEVARLILDELSSTQIAERLFISFNTVETHRKRIYQKLGITSALGLLKALRKRE
jgi:DNA-binding NarL/FixJ family response regulator